MLPTFQWNHCNVSPLHYVISPILHLTSSVPHGFHPNCCCHWRLPSFPVLLWLHWHSRWHSHPCIRTPRRPPMHAKLQRVPLEKLSIHLQFWLLLYLCTYRVGWVHGWCCTLGNCLYHQTLYTGGQVYFWRCGFWAFQNHPRSLPWCVLSPEGMAPGKIPVSIHCSLFNWRTTNLITQSSKPKRTLQPATCLSPQHYWMHLQCFKVPMVDITDPPQI